MSKLQRIIKGWSNDNRNKRGELPPELKELFDSRFKICKTNKCRRLLAGICTECGCPVRKKTKVVDEECPLNLWEPVKYEIEGRECILLSELPPQLHELLYTATTISIIPDPSNDSNVLGIMGWRDWQEFLLSIDRS